VTLSDHIADKSRVVAVLGPTNTGKTHLAIERMLGHSSGMIGFPLRLLARENYDKICRLRGAQNVALVTGEERIIPRGARYWVCTVESMPVDRPVSFLAVDEIQLAADPERGHIFTDRLLNARGFAETMFLGSDTMRPIIRRLVPGVEFISRPRLSSLTYAGPKKLTRLPPRSAVVAFSASDVYAIAELMRRQRGGTAVVLGALSPRTRNAQVEMYQAGEVDYLVATDAIGMGLNMDVDHVAFARMVKFDGFAPRQLLPMEVGQIAGRAGRHMNDGTFGTTEDVGALDAELIQRVEEHQYDMLRQIVWRNNELDFRSVTGLLRSLERRPPDGELMIRRRDADDHAALAVLADTPLIRNFATSKPAVRLLWEVCQIPDFSKVMSDEHARLLGRIYEHLIQGDGRLPEDWVSRLVARLDRNEGDIDALVGRIAHIRTWTYISHRGTWLEDSKGWQEKTRAIEDRLSDALHSRLTERFVDRRSAMLVRRLASGATLLGCVMDDGEVQVEGARVGQLAGFRFEPESGNLGEDERAVLAAARRILKDEISGRVRSVQTAGDDAFTLAATGLIEWDGVPVARLVTGDDVLAPRVQVLDSALFESGQSDKIRDRLQSFVLRWVRRRLEPLFALDEAQRSDARLGGAGRGLAYQLVEGLGTLARFADGDPAGHVEKADRAILTKLGVRFGRKSIWVASLVKPAAAEARALLWAVNNGLALPAPVPQPGRVSAPRAEAVPDAFYEACGYMAIGRLAVRIDVLERTAGDIAERAKDGPFATPVELASRIGGRAEDVEALLRSLSFKQVQAEDGSQHWRRRRRSEPHRPRPAAGTTAGAPKSALVARSLRGRDESPFAVLKQLMTAGGR
jgi:ATP-dependent RNA helicase SUPV3L1/SUV3